MCELSRSIFCLCLLKNHLLPTPVKYGVSSGPAPEYRDWGGRKKYLGGYRSILPSSSGGKTKKKIFILAVYLFSEHKARSGGARSLPGGARRNLTVRISLLAHKFRGEEKEKKRLQREILGLVFAYTHVFHPGRKLYLRLGGAEVPKMHSSGTCSVTFFRGTILAWGAHFSLGEHTSRLGGTSSDLGVHGPEMYYNFTLVQLK